ncbi:molybdopterin-dependent oxidoreductase [Chryseolinea soli]|uniref:Molybdopterin-binding protein n=1 Tax=Chryseolinea soli TaxID=2321403 RepID=A0A385SJV3_9BACT|nr:molybdopterin-dependent oxidoreductase [Chryseolinea soli]AYB29670.1 molybdopterin-binding protein [Chryseolinea soli]
MSKKLCNPFLLAALVLASIAGHAQPKPSFRVEGEVLKPRTLTQDDLLKWKTAEVKGKDRDGKEHVFKGVRLVDVLDSAGVTLGAKLRGENLAKYVLVKAADGYEVIFSLPEIDPEFTSQTVLLAYEVDGHPLAKGEGPFRMVVPSDKKQARWIRELTTIKVVFSKD